MHVCIIQEGCLWHPRGIAALLDKNSKCIDKLGYQRNEYDWCTMNKNFKGKQCTIIWKVDDLKIWHVDSGILSSIIADIDVEYENIEK